MRLTVVASQGQAINLGRNQTEWITEIDVSALTPAERECLARWAGRGTSRGSYSAGQPIVDRAGEITVESIRAAMAHEQAEAAKEAEEEAKRVARDIHDCDKTLAEAKEALAEYLADPERSRPHILMDDRTLISRRAYATHAPEGYREDEYQALCVQAAAEEQRRKQAKLAANVVAMEADESSVAAYEAGGERPKTLASYCFEAHRDRFLGLVGRLEAEDKRREQIKADRLTAQLAEAVASLGTTSQQERWAAGVMPRSEAIELITKDAVAPLTVAGLEVLPHEYHLGYDAFDLPGEGDCQECIDSGKTSAKKTLTDAEWKTAKDICARVPEGAQVEYEVETADCSDHGKRQLVYAHCAWDVGDVHVSIDVPLSEV